MLVEAPSSSGSSTQQQTLDFETVIHSLQQWNQEKQEQERKYNELAKRHEIRKKQFSELEKEHLSLLQLLEKASSLVNSKK